MSEIKMKDAKKIIKSLKGLIEMFIEYRNNDNQEWSIPIPVTIDKTEYKFEIDIREVK